jgi:hypothetical protein
MFYSVTIEGNINLEVNFFSSCVCVFHILQKETIFLFSNEKSEGVNNEIVGLIKFRQKISFRTDSYKSYILIKGSSLITTTITHKKLKYKMVA